MIDGLNLSSPVGRTAPLRSPALDAPPEVGPAPEDGLSLDGDVREAGPVGRASSLELPGLPPAPPESEEDEDFELDELVDPVVEPPSGVPAAAAPVDDTAAPADAADLRRRADTIFFGESNVAPEPFRQIERDAFDVNMIDPGLDARATAQVKANGPLEAQAQGQLSPADRAAYERVTGVLKDQPQARLAMQTLLVEGKLTDPALATKGKNLVQTLADASRADLVNSIDRRHFVGDLAREVATPTAINQQNRGTCTVTSLQIKMAMEHPAEYARLATGLGSPNGQVQLANGETLTRSKNSALRDDTYRTASSRLFQAAMMEYGNGSYKYDNQTDSHARRGSGVSGLAAPQVDRVLDGLTGQDHQVRTIDMMAGIEEQLKAGRSVPVGVQWGQPDDQGKIHGGHEILVTKMTEDRVSYHNPWGKEESMSRTEFESRLGTAHLERAATTGQANPAADPELARNLGQVQQNVGTVLKELEGVVGQVSKNKQSPDGYLMQGALKTNQGTLRELNSRLAGLSLPGQVDEATRTQIMDQLNVLNNAAVSLAPGPQGSSFQEAARTMTSALKALEALGVK